MTLRFTVPNSGLVIEAADSENMSADLNDLCHKYEAVGGSRKFLEAHIARSIATLEHGPAVATAVAALEQHSNQVATEVVGEDGESQEVDDPWASGPAERKTQNVPPRQAPRQQQSGGQQHRGDPAQYLGEDRFGNKFYRDPSAPNCDCGQQAIRGAFTSQAGKKYGAHVCFDAGPKDAGADYKQKCSFREFINTKKGR